MRLWRKIASIVGVLILLWIFIGTRLEIQDLKAYREELKLFTELDEYGTVPLLSVVTGNRAIYEFDDYMGENGLTYELYYHSADADGELEQYGEHLRLNGYTEIVPEQKDSKRIIEYQRSNPKWNDKSLHVAAWRIEGGFKLCLSGF